MLNKRMYYHILAICCCILTNLAIPRTFDADNYADIILVDNTNNYATWYENDGNNETVVQRMNISSPRSCICSGYFNDDIQYDILLGKSNNSASWYKYDNNNGLTWVTNFGNDVVEMEISDFDSDGSGDIIVITGDQSIKWYESTGGAGLTWRSNLFNSNSGIKDLTLWDINSDETMDLLTINSNGIQWYEPEDNHSLSWNKQLLADENLTSLCIGLFDNDNFPDIFVVTSSGSSNVVKWYEYNDPNLIQVGTYFSSGATCLDIGDADGDGIQELLVGRSNNDVSWYQCTGNDEIQWKSCSAFGNNAKDITILPSDILRWTIFTSSGTDIDVMFPYLHTHSDPNDLMRLCFNTGTHGGDEFFNGMDSEDYGSTWEIQDDVISVDTCIDVAERPFSTMAISYKTTEFNANTRWAQIRYLYNNTPPKDLLTVNGNIEQGESFVNWYEPSSYLSTPNYVDKIYDTDSNCPPTCVEIYDIDTDGIKEVLVGRLNAGILWFEPNETDNQLELVTGSTGYHDTVEIAATESFDPNYPTYIFTLLDDGSLIWYKSNTINNTLSYVGEITDIATSVIVGDFDKDNYLDLFVGKDNSSNQTYWLEENTQRTSFDQVATIASGGPSNDIDMGYFDDDDDTDLFVVQQNGNVLWYENTGNNTISYISSITSSAYSVELTNFDIDGKPDLFIGKANCIAWYISDSNDTISWAANLDSITNTRSFASGSLDKDKYTSRWVKVTCPEDTDVNDMRFHRSIVQTADTTFLATTFGKYDSDTYQRVIIVESNDLGASWEYKSTVATWESWMGGNGPCEPVMVKLHNNNLLCIFRTGDWCFDAPNDAPLAYAISQDNGGTWSDPCSLEVYGVSPDAIVLPDHRVVVSYGRPGVHLMVADPNATTWEEPIDIYFGATCGYTGVRLDPEPNSNDTTLSLIYTESDFGKTQNIIHPYEYNNLKMLIIDIDSP